MDGWPTNRPAVVVLASPDCPYPNPLFEGQHGWTGPWPTTGLSSSFLAAILTGSTRFAARNPIRRA